MTDPNDATAADRDAVLEVKARYFRHLDTKDWDAFRAVFVDDVVVDTTASGGGVVTGADAFVDFLRETLADTTTVHHGHTPEIAFVSVDEATGIWAMQDLLIWPDGTRLQGYGHYHETYRRVDGAWRIATTTLTRLHMDVVPPPVAEPGDG